MARDNKIKNIFLSASIPLPERDAKYFDTADIIAIRDAVIALTTVVLPHHRIVWGGHPSITPLIYYVMEKTIKNKVEREIKGFENIPQEEQEKIIFQKTQEEISSHVQLYQSRFFEKFFPADNNKFKNVVLTDIIENDRDKSLFHMRQRMLVESEFSAAVFIGGMEGIDGDKEKEIEGEYKMFVDRYPNALLLPIASTGGATKIIYDTIFPEELKNERFVKDYGYMSLFQKFLMDRI